MNLWDEIPARTASPQTFSGYKILNRDQVLDKLKQAGFPPAFSRVKLDHVTHTYPSSELPPPASTAHVTGHVSGDGVQALEVHVDGNKARDDGSTFHLTYSLAAGHKAVESNDLFHTHKVEPVGPIELDIEPYIGQ